MKILIILTIILLFFTASIAKENVFFNEDTPFLDKIYIVLKSNNYVLTKDSINANYYGELTTKNKKDSTQYIIMIKTDYAKKIIGSFSMEQIKKTDVRKNMKRYVFYGFFLNSMILLLYFLRST
jgi:hypothetical protein